MNSKATMNQQMAEPVLEFLSQKCKLPSSGILAGQALASAVMDLFGDGGGVYNDIDVFRTDTPARLAEIAAQYEKLAIEMGVSLNIYDEYAELQNQQLSKSFSIIGSTRDGVLNEVWCDVPGSSTQLRALAVLGTFDLNCVEIALDLETKKLYWTHAFERFFNTRELELTSLTTPVRTLIRYAKKRKELDVTGNDDFTYQLIAMTPSFVSKDEWVPEFSPRFLGYTPKHAAIFNSFPELAEWFELAPLERERHPLLARKQPNHEVILNLCERGSSHLNLNQVPAEAYSLLRDSVTKSTEAGEDMADEVSDFVSESGNIFVEGCFESKGLSYIDTFDKEHFKLLDRVLYEGHSDVFQILDGLTLLQQHTALELIFEKSDQKRNSVIWSIVINQAIPLYLSKIEFLEDFLDYELARLKGKLNENIFDTVEYKGWVLSEITTGGDIELVLNKDKHPLECYAYNLLNRNHHMISVVNKEKPELNFVIDVSGYSLSRKRLYASNVCTFNNNWASRRAQKLKDIAMTYYAKQKGLEFSSEHYDFL